jgi:hypothetical protein
MLILSREEVRKMGIKTKSLSDTTEKYVKNTSTAGSYYQKGIENPRRPCIESAKAAEPLYEEGVAAAIARKGFSAGLDKVSETDWKNAAISKGVSRYPTGCKLSKDKYNKSMGEVLSHMSGIDLPPKGTRGSPANIARSVAFQEEMAKFRTG